MQVPQHFSTALSFQQQVVYVLSLMKKGTPEELAMELMELTGTASEEGVARLTIEIEKELDKLKQEGVIKKEKDRDGTLRAALQNENNL